ncbi:MAG: circadian clock KaiB family protein [Pleurocapsa sp.]
MKDTQSSLPKIFKGIAIFTPGGDVIYGVDPHKQARWHLHLCQGLQEIWGLSEPPHFLVPGYTATVEHWLDPQTQQIKVIAEAYPAVQRYIPLLTVLFDLELTETWQIAPWQEEYCDRTIIETYRQQFPQLWEERDIIARFDPKHLEKPPETSRLRQINNQQLIIDTPAAVVSPKDKTGGYVLHLFISGDRSNTEQTLATIHQVLEKGLTTPYTLKVIDIQKNPEQAEIRQISATPTLVRVSPLPVRRIVGQLDDIQRVLRIISSF